MSYTDGCVSGECSTALSTNSHLSQGTTFSQMTKELHGGRRTRRNRRNMRGGAAAYPGDFSQELPTELHKAAYVENQDAAFAALPSFVGKYGMSGGSRKTANRRASRKAENRRASRKAENRRASRKAENRRASRKAVNRRTSRKAVNRRTSRKAVNRRASRKAVNRRGGFYEPGSATAKNYMILSPQEESAAQLNPQWYEENLVVPSYVAPVNGLANQVAQAYANQTSYQTAGRRVSSCAMRS